MITQLHGATASMQQSQLKQSQTKAKLTLSLENQLAKLETMPTTTMARLGGLDSQLKAVERRAAPDFGWVHKARKWSTGHGPARHHERRRAASGRHDGLPHERPGSTKGAREVGWISDVCGQAGS